MLQIELLQGGITNKLYKVRFEHASVIVRIYGDHTEHFIHRERDNGKCVTNTMLHMLYKRYSGVCEIIKIGVRSSVLWMFS